MAEEKKEMKKVASKNSTKKPVAKTKSTTGTAKTNSKKTNAPKKETVSLEKTKEKDLTEIKEETSPTPPIESTNRKKIIIAGTCIALVLLGLYIYSWYNVKKEEKLMNSYLLTSGTISLNIQNLEEVNQVLFSNETPENFFVLISYTKDEDTYELEKDLKKIIDDYKLNDSFYYLNVLDLMKDDQYLEKINQTFKTTAITKLPTILYYKNAELQEVVKRSDNHIIKSGDFQKLLDIYEFKDQ